MNFKLWGDKESIEGPILREFSQQLSLSLVLWWKLNYFYGIKVGCPMCEANQLHVLHITPFILFTWYAWKFTTCEDTH